MEEDLRAMTQIQQALAGLDEKALARVLTWATSWAADRYGISIRTEPSKNGSRGKGLDEDEPGQPDTELDNLAGLYEAARPASESEKVLVVSYWLQKIQGQETLDAQEVNNELKNLGHAIKNITRAFSALMDQKPQLAVQIRKSGSTQQARKRYKITNAGLRRVEDMLGRRREE